MYEKAKGKLILHADVREAIDELESIPHGQTEAEEYGFRTALDLMKEKLAEIEDSTPALLTAELLPFYTGYRTVKHYKCDKCKNEMTKKMRFCFRCGRRLTMKGEMIK